MVDSISLAQSFEIFAKYAHLEHKIHSIVNNISINIDSTKIDVEDAVKLEDLGWKLTSNNLYSLKLEDFKISGIGKVEGETCLGCNGEDHKIEDCPIISGY